MTKYHLWFHPFNSLGQIFALFLEIFYECTICLLCNFKIDQNYTTGQKVSTPTFNCKFFVHIQYGILKQFSNIRVIPKIGQGMYT